MIVLAVFIVIIALTAFCGLWYVDEGKAKKLTAFLGAVILFAAFVYCAFAARNAVAEDVEEIRTCWIYTFNLATAQYAVKDEDGYLFWFSLGKGTYTIGDEYELHVNEENYYLVPCPEEIDFM